VATVMTDHAADAEMLAGKSPPCRPRRCIARSRPTGTLAVGESRPDVAQLNAALVAFGDATSEQLDPFSDRLSAEGLLRGCRFSLRCYRAATVGFVQPAPSWQSEPSKEST
jgi:hypothetical protein